MLKCYTILLLTPSAASLGLSFATEKQHICMITLHSVRLVDPKQILSHIILILYICILILYNTRTL